MYKNRKKYKNKHLKNTYSMNFQSSWEQWNVTGDHVPLAVLACDMTDA